MAPTVPDLSTEGMSQSEAPLCGRAMTWPVAADRERAESEGAASRAASTEASSRSSSPLETTRQERSAGADADGQRGVKRSRKRAAKQQAGGGPRRGPGRPRTDIRSRRPVQVNRRTYATLAPRSSIQEQRPLQRQDGPAAMRTAAAAPNGLNVYGTYVPSIGGITPPPLMRPQVQWRQDTACSLLGHAEGAQLMQGPVPVFYSSSSSGNSADDARWYPRLGTASAYISNDPEFGEGDAPTGGMPYGGALWQPRVGTASAYASNNVIPAQSDAQTGSMPYSGALGRSRVGATSAYVSNNAGFSQGDAQGGGMPYSVPWHSDVGSASAYVSNDAVPRLLGTQTGGLLDMGAGSLLDTQTGDLLFATSSGLELNGSINMDAFSRLGPGDRPVADRDMRLRMPQRRYLEDWRDGL